MGIPGGLSSSSLYDVFLIFHRSDTPGFADFLYHGLLDAGLHVFSDVKEPPTGVDKRAELIELSKIAIPIISCNYASSRLLMDDLVKLCEFKKNPMNQNIIPVYYYVTSFHMRNRKSYLRSGGDSQAINLWKLALEEIANLKGFCISDKCDDGEALIMKRIISTVKRQLVIVSIVVPRNLVGVENHVQNILKLGVVYDRELTHGVHVIGICGRPGIGKTTLARLVYDYLRPLYCSSTFLTNAGERSPASLQEQLIRDLQKPEYTRPVNFEEGCETLKRKFRQKRVLIVLDDVRDFKSIKTLAGNLHWFGQGSSIIITCKTRGALDCCDCKHTSKTGDVLDYYEGADAEIYEFGPLEPDKALELFHKHAFREGQDYQSLSKSICSAVGWLPLAIEIVGSYLKEKEIETWQKTFDILERASNTEAGVLRESSYILREIVKAILQDISASNEHLGKSMKEMFFDISCFLFAADERFALCMWSSCNRSTIESMQELRRLRFLETVKKNFLGMHEQLRHIGREMAKQDDLEEHGGCRRLWRHQDALSTLKEGKGTAEVEALCLTLDRNSDIHLTCEEFKELSNLKYLSMNHADTSGDFKNLLSELRWLQWHGCPETLKARRMHLEKLVVLDLSWSKITEDWQGWREIQMPQLKVLNLTGCTDLLVTPKFYAYPNLEILILKHCHKLGKLDSSVVTLQRLVCLNLKYCRSLHELPDGIGNIEALEELLIDHAPMKEIPGLVGADELEALRSASTQHSNSMLSQEVSSVHEQKQLKIFACGSICIKRNSKKDYLDLTGKLVGIDHHGQEILRKLDIVNHDGRSVKQYGENVHAVQIFGVPGVGKTTLAKAVYNKIRHLYPCCSFLEDISENANRKIILALQRQLLSDLQRQECPELNSSDEATRIIKHTFCNQRVLMVFDNVNSHKHIHPFMQKLSWFGPGSKIIITTSRRSIATADESKAIAKYEVEQMTNDEALQLFIKHAFRGCPPEEDYYSLSRKIISVIGRLPLSIEVVASHLY